MFEFRIKNKKLSTKRRLRRVSRFLILNSLFLILIVSCSTEKAKWTHIQYHNTTCHYNVWWNGNESLKAGKKKLRSSAVDDFTQFIPVENIGTDEVARSLNPEFDRAVEKGIKGVTKHSIYVKGEEHVPYIKECYLLTAYATFYKHDFISTVNTCNILVEQFKGTRAGDEGSVLLARCMTMEKRYAEAEAALDQLVHRLANGNFTRNQRDKLYMAMVEATVPQGKYKKAVEFIHEAIDATGDRYVKARLTFLMAQIYRKLEKRSVAAKYYGMVSKLRPPYVLEFNAKLGEASCADLEHTDVQRLERQLDEMLRDKKNEEYRDQIYFAKGEMYLGMKEPAKASESYRLSVAAATVNKSQKAQSALRMGELQYEVFENYSLAQRYYDTVMQNITRDYPGYEGIKRRHDMLDELVSYTSVYERCDSLLAVAAMSEGERMTLINAKIDTLRRQEKEAREREKLEELRADAREQQNTLSGDWYFYTPKTVQQGKETFRQRWGLRTLEDLWFLSNKNTMGLALMDDDGDGESNPSPGDSATLTLSKAGNPDDPHDAAYYLKDLPATPHAYDSIDSLTSISLLNAGYIFYDGIHNVPRSLECYHRLADQYTSFDEIVQTFYMLYRIYDRQGNTPQANYYRDMVLMGFPDSDFANLIRDNEYYKELIRRDRRIENDYEELYTHYADGHYTTVISQADEAEKNYAGNASLSKFRYWKGLALARKGNRSDAVGLLTQLAALPSTDSIQPLAEAQLEFLADSSFVSGVDDEETITEADEQRVRKTETLEVKSEEEALPVESQIYRFRENQQYYVIIIVNDRTVKATELQFKIGEFNNTYYSNSGYKVNAALFTDTTQLLTIHRFLTADEAMGYWHHLQQQESPLRQYAESDHLEYVISTQNYATFYNRKDAKAYDPFFKKYYLKKQ